MPNYSHNRLTISTLNDNNKSLNEFNSFISDNIIYNNKKEPRELIFSGLLPQPETLPFNDDILTKYNKNDPAWYIWNCEIWGTKWEPTTNHINITENSITIHYDTAWTPAEKWLNHIAALYKNLNIEIICNEEGGAFEGKGVAVDGKFKWEIDRPAKWTLDSPNNNQT